VNGEALSPASPVSSVSSVSSVVPDHDGQGPLHLSQSAESPSTKEQIDDIKVPPHIQITQTVAIGSVVALIVLSVLWELWLAPIRPGGSWLCLKALPLCIPLTGLLKNRLYTYRWLSLWIWFYFIEGVVRVWGDAYPSKLYAALEVAICLALFGACAMHVRFRFENAKKHTEQDKKEFTRSTDSAAL